MNDIDDDPKPELHFSGSVEPCMSDCIPGVATVSQRARVLDATPDEDL